MTIFEELKSLKAKAEIKRSVSKWHLERVCAVPLHWSSCALRQPPGNLDDAWIDIDANNVSGRASEACGHPRPDTGATGHVQHLISRLRRHNANHKLRPVSKHARNHVPLICLCSRRVDGLIFW
ncbi:MAG: hypothetical protein Q8M77_19210 [Hydrogenophaga sp.]|nr:hypothetical protein [Hydrogenophaga sp.]